MHAQPVAGLADDEDRRVARQPRQRARRRRRRRRRCGKARDAAGRGWRCGSGRRRRPDRGWPAAGRRSGRAARRCLSPFTDRSKLRVAARRHRRERAAAGRAASPRVSSCRRAAASRSTRLPRRARTSSIVSSSWKRSCAGPTTTAGAVGDQVIDLETEVGARPRSRRAGWTARCAAGRPGPRAWLAAGASASSTMRTMSIAECATSASQTVTPSRPARQRRRRAGVWPNVGRPAPRRTASARLCMKRAGSSAACAESQATQRPSARCSRRHCAISEVLPKPAGACTRMTGRSRSSSRSICRRGRASCWLGTRGGVTFSSRSSGAPLVVSRGKSRHELQPSAVGRRVGAKGGPGN